MLIKTILEQKSLKEYRDIIPKEQYAEIEQYTQKLQGIKIVHVNATQYGGGPAEILKSLAPLMQDVGLQAEWYIIPQKEEFYRVLLTKKINLAFQGGTENLSQGEKESYTESSKILAQMAQELKPDIWVMHDSQPLGSARFIHDSAKKILRIHVDLSNPNHDTWEFLRPSILHYDKTIFHMDEFVPQDFPNNKKAVFPVAIDPLFEKNQKMDVDEAKKVVAKHGIDISKPLLVNISRFDKLKDPIGMVDAYRKAKIKIPDLQFALIGLMIATDDPEAAEIFERTKRYVGKDPDIFLFEDPGKIHVDVSLFVRAFQTAADVIIHKALYEGFGMVVTEAMIKGKPVIAGNVGGLKLQIKNGENGFLVNSVDEAADRIVELMQNPELRKRLGEAAEKSAKANFLTPRLLLDYLKLFTEVLGR